MTVTKLADFNNNGRPPRSSAERSRRYRARKKATRVAPPRHAWFRVAIGVLLASLAVFAAYAGLRASIWYGASLAAAPEARVLMSSLVAIADGLALTMPAAALWLWRDHARGLAMVAWGVWFIAAAGVLMAVAGFLATNISDRTATRDGIATERARVASRIERLTRERTGIAETRSVAALEAALQEAQPKAAGAWSRTDGCRDVTLPASGQACAPVLEARAALAQAQRRDALDASIRDTEARLRALPAVTSADPQAEGTAKLLVWMTGAGVETADIQNGRLVALVLLPQLAGLILAIGVGLWRPTS